MNNLSQHLDLNRPFTLCGIAVVTSAAVSAECTHVAIPITHSQISKVSSTLVPYDTFGYTKDI